jgi:hypothetical protein
MSLADALFGWAIVTLGMITGSLIGLVLLTQWREVAERQSERRALDGWARMEDERRARSAARQADERELREAWERSEKVNLDRDGQ